MNQIATVARALLRVVLAVLRGAVGVLLTRIDNGRIRRGVGPMDRGQRRTATWLIGFVFGMLALFLVATSGTSPKPAVTATPTPRPYVAETTTPAPTPTPEPVATTAPEPAPSDTYVDVDVPHMNLPDGALTGGYCRHKWWC